MLYIIPFTSLSHILYMQYIFNIYDEEVHSLRKKERIKEK